MVVRLEEIREARKAKALVCDVHEVACFKPEKKAKWKHVNTCSCCFKWQVPSQESASGWELKAARVTTWPFIQHSWTPMTGLNALLWPLPDSRILKVLLSLAMCVWLLLQHRNNSQKSNIKWTPEGFVIHHEQLWPWKQTQLKRQQTCRRTAHAHMSSRTLTHTELFAHKHACTHTY